MGLFSWLRSKVSGDRPDFYSPGEKLIYSFFNGKEVVHADPMSLYKRVAARGGDLDTSRKVARSQLMKPADVAKAHDDVIRYIREIFDLPVPKGLDCTDTLTEEQCVDLLDHFYMFVGVKKNSVNPTPMPAGETLGASPSSSGDAPATPSSSASGSAASENSTEKVEPPPSPSPSPSVSSLPETVIGTP